MASKIEIKDLAYYEALSQKELAGVRGGLAEGFLFRTRSSSSLPVQNTYFDIENLAINNFDITNNIDKLIRQTNNLTQLNVVDVIATGGSNVDVVVDQGIASGNQVV